MPSRTCRTQRSGRVPEPPAPCAAALAAACALVLALPGCTPGHGEAKKGGPPPVTVEAAQITPELLRDVAKFSGELRAERSVVIKSETDGIIEHVDFEEGQLVSEGDVLFRLRSGEQEARLREAKANLALAIEVAGRTQKLFARNAVSTADVDRTQAELEVARARVDLARLELDRTKIRAPFDGAVGLRLVDIGDRIEDDTPLVQLDDIDRLQALFAMSEHGVAFARKGVRVWVEVAPYPGEKFPGEVFYVSPSIDSATRRLLIKAWVPNGERRLRPGLFANVDLEIAQRDHALLVPESAVVFDRHGTFVWRLDDENVASRVPIDTGLRKSGRVEVTMGLRPGDKIVTAGTHKVSEGKQVLISGPAPTGQASRDVPSGGRTGEGT